MIKTRLHNIQEKWSLFELIFADSATFTTRFILILYFLLAATLPRGRFLFVG